MSTTFSIHDPRASVVLNDESSTALLRELRAPVRDGQSSGVFIAALAAILSFGMYPALVWPLRLRQVIEADRARLKRVADWLGSRVSHPDMPRLKIAADAIRFRPVFYLVGAAGCLLWVVLLFTCSGPRLPDWPLLNGSTYSFQPAWGAGADWVSQFLLEGTAAPKPVIRNAIFFGWVVVLAAAFIGNWIQVQLHARSVRRFLDEFNKIALHDALSPVFLAPIGSGLRPFWVIAAIALAGINAPWGIPMMLAGSVQRRYAKRAGPEMRGALATQLGEMMVLRRPLGSVAVTPGRAGADTRRRCATEGCRLPLPNAAGFCPRCGKRAV